MCLYKHRLYITNIAVTERTGIISKSVKTIDMEDITDIIVKQGALQRLLNMGHIHINTNKSNADHELVVRDTADPFEIKKIIEEMTRKREYYPSRISSRHDSNVSDEHRRHGAGH